MDKIIFLVSLSVIFGSFLTGFSIFRLTGMRLALHFGALIIGFLLTLSAIITNIPIVGYLAIASQIIIPLTICPTICGILKTQFQNTGIYSAHLGFIGMILILGIGNIFM